MHCPRLITSSTIGYDGSMMNGLQSLDAWASYFKHPTGGKLGLLNAIQVRNFHFFLHWSFSHHQTIGALAAFPFAPYFSDGFGRRPTVFLGATIMCIATIIQTASQSVGMFIGARYVPRAFMIISLICFLSFLIGFGVTFAGNYRVAQVN